MRKYYSQHLETQENTCTTISTTQVNHVAEEREDSVDFVDPSEFRIINDNSPGL